MPSFLFKTFLAAGLAGLFVAAVPVAAENTVSFFVDSKYDHFGRERLEAILVEDNERSLFYVETEWWQSLSEEKREESRDYLKILSYEFEENIFPILSDTYGWDWDATVSGQEIYVLIHQMRGAAGGYFRSVDQRDPLQNPGSNQKQMVYLNSSHLNNYYMRSLLAHELTHLITYHKKEKAHQVREETWLNEARAEYAATLLSYDRTYEGSNLQRRAKTFLEYPNNSLVSWEDKSADYGALNLFTQYLVDHYGIEILVDSLNSHRTGIASLNEALVKNGHEEDFAEIYNNWTIAVLVNDCSLGEYYCYRSNNLKDLRIIPSTNFLPLSEGSRLSSTERLQNWGARWIRFIGGEGDLQLKFFGQSETLFRVPYVAIDRKGERKIGFIELNNYQNGEINLANFGNNYYSVTIIPSVQSKQSGFNGVEEYYPFKWEANTRPTAEKEQLARELREKIEELRQQITYLRSQIAMALARQQGILLNSFERDLSFGQSSESVKALQLFLAIQEPETYPEGLVTGNFYELTRRAVIRFQEKYADDILKPSGLSAGTGYVGVRTRAKLNELLFVESP